MRVGLLLYSLALLSSSAAALHGQARAQPVGGLRASAAAAPAAWPPADLPAAGTRAGRSRTTALGT
jgi:hypothetical protein